ncbi:DUF2129 domain-containing protein [Streptococcus hyovaginalis]
MLGQRQVIIFWLFSLKQAKLLRRYCTFHFISNRFKYVVLSTNPIVFYVIMKTFFAHSFFQKFSPSYSPFLQFYFKNSRPDKQQKLVFKIVF